MAIAFRITFMVLEVVAIISHSLGLYLLDSSRRRGGGIESTQHVYLIMLSAVEVRRGKEFVKAPERDLP